MSAAHAPDVAPMLTEKTVVLDHDNLEEFRDPQTYDIEDAGYDEDQPLVEQLAREHGGPLLDLACGTGRMAIPLALQGYDVTGVDITPEMVEWGRQKAAKQGANIDWVLADARAFHLDMRFRFIFMLANAFQFFLTRADQEALLARVREHLHPGGCFLFETRNPSPRNLYEVFHPEPRRFTTPDGKRLVIAEQQRYDPMTQIQYYICQNQWLHPENQQVEREKTNVKLALRYVFPQEIEALLYYNGFQIRACYGSWQQEPLTADSREMIFVCRLRDEPAITLHSLTA